MLVLFVLQNILHYIRSRSEQDYNSAFLGMKVDYLYAVVKHDLEIGTGKLLRKS